MSTGTAAAPPWIGTRTRMRGWLHFWSFVVSLGTGATLVWVAAATVSARAALITAVYGVTVSAMFGVSATYHRRIWISETTWLWMKRLDHSMIFVFIGGTYTPFALLSMDPATGRAVLAVVWGGAIAGVALKLVWPRAPRWLGVLVYASLGWVAVFVLPQLLHHAGVAALVLLLAGGAFYTIGAVFYATRWPNRWPLTFGSHDCFHAATILAATCHYIAVWLALYA